MIPFNKIVRIGVSAVLLALCFSPSATADEKCKTITFTGVTADEPTTGNEGIEITAGDDSCTVNLPAGLTNNGDAAQEFVTQCNGVDFTITRVGNEVKICHPTKTPKIRKVNLANKVMASVYDDKALRSYNLIEARGVAEGGGLVAVANGPVNVQVPTFAGETAEQVVDQLVLQFEALAELNGEEDWLLGAEYTAGFFGGPPLDSADLGIYQLGPLDLGQTSFNSTDPGIQLFQEAPPQGFPTSCAGGPTSCGCDNPGAPGTGCLNSTGGGSTLHGAGVASLTNDSFQMFVVLTPNQPGLYFQGGLTLGAGQTFGDGVRCCGGHLLRLGTYLPAGNSTNYLGGNRIDGPIQLVSQHPGNAGLQPGESRCYQWWHRDPQGPCGSGFNLSNSIQAVWQL